eukprot:383336-Prymnesium_polylepis.2
MARAGRSRRVRVPFGTARTAHTCACSTRRLPSCSSALRSTARSAQHILEVTAAAAMPVERVAEMMARVAAAAMAAAEGRAAAADSVVAVAMEAAEDAESAVARASAKGGDPRPSATVLPAAVRASEARGRTG